MRNIRITVLAVIVALAVAACASEGTETGATATRDAGSGEAPTEATEGTATGGSTTAETVTEETSGVNTTATDTASGGSGGEIPDPCGLVSSADLESMLGADPESGVVESLGPNERQICSYGSGLVIFVDHAANWDGQASFGLIQNPSVAVEVGEEAYWQDIGTGASQLVALGEGYFIGVMIPSTDQATAEQVANAVLSALG